MAPNPEQELFEEEPIQTTEEESPPSESTQGLFNYYLDSGEGIIVDGGRNVRRYTVGEAGDFIKYEETIINESKIWVALTKDAAKGQADLNEQPAGEDEVYSWSYREDQRVVGSYILQRDYERKITSVVDTAPPPNVENAPTLSPAGTSSVFNSSASGSSPFDVVITRSHPSAKIFYRVRYAIRPGNFSTVGGETFPSTGFSEHSGASVSVNVNIPSQSQNYIRSAAESSSIFGTWQQVARIDAYEVVTLTNTESGEPESFTSPTITRYFQYEPLTVSKTGVVPTINPPGQSFGLPPNVSSWPHSVSISAPSGYHIRYRVGHNTSNGWITAVDWNTQESNSINVSLSQPPLFFGSRTASLRARAVQVTPVASFREPIVGPTYYRSD